MTEIFSVVESELSQLVDFGEELDPLNSLNMLVVIGQRVTRAQQVGSMIIVNIALYEPSRDKRQFIKSQR